jgi:hypothetical protein
MRIRVEGEKKKTEKEVKMERRWIETYRDSGDRQRKKEDRKRDR